MGQDTTRQRGQHRSERECVCCVGAALGTAALRAMYMQRPVHEFLQACYHYGHEMKHELKSQHACCEIQDLWTVTSHVRVLT